MKRKHESRWEASPGGLVAALRPALQKRDASWVGWPGATVDLPEGERLGEVKLRAVPLSARDVECFYRGFCNSTIWPLYHDAIRVPEFDRSWWTSYVAANQRFAASAADAAGDSGAVWIHDYHLQLAPAMLRARAPAARIGFFMHIPFPPRELFARLPWRREVLEGLLGADLVGFQTERDARNFVECAERYAGVCAEAGGVRVGGRTARIGAFPISIDFREVEALAATPRAEAQAAELRRRLVNRPRVMLGVDRLDYTKGIDVRLRAFQEMLERGRVTTDECVLVQIAVPTREDVAQYATMREQIEQLVGRINGDHGEPGRVAVHFLRRNLSPEELAAYYRLADVMVVTPLRDGMNLVAKEYVASRTDADGALVLSEFAGAAEELRDALLVNPFDVDGVATALEQAALLPRQEAHRRMASMRETVRRHDVFAWAESFLGALGE